MNWSCNGAEEEVNTIKLPWKRYLDDCFILWNKSIEKLTAFHHYPNIKFTE
jgi:hypothetical protein